MKTVFLQKRHIAMTLPVEANKEDADDFRVVETSGRTSQKPAVEKDEDNTRVSG